MLVDHLNNLLAKSLSIALSFDLHHENLLDLDFVSVDEPGRNRRHVFDGLLSIEEGCVVDLLVFELSANRVKALLVLGVVAARERQQATGVDTDRTHGETLSWEVTALDQEHLVDVVWDPGEEPDRDLELLTCQDLTLVG